MSTKRHTPAKAPARRTASRYAPPAIPAQSYHFHGSLANASGGAAVFPFGQPAFTVLAGEGGATIIGGFAKWAVIDRARRVGINVLQGYDPLVLSVPIRFDAITTGSATALERDIQILTWMGGRGKLFASDGRVGAAGYGDSPIVNLYSATSSGVETPLIPPDAQGIDWVISGLAFSEDVLRDNAGYRIRQDATVTLTQHVGSPGTSADSAAVRSRARKSLRDKYKVITTRDGMDTYLQIAASVAPKNPHKAAVDIQAANKTNSNRKARVRSVNAHMGAHVRIRVPLVIYTGLSA